MPSRLRPTRAIATLALVALLAGCVTRPGATTPPPSPTPTPAPTAASGALVLKISYVGGFVAPSWRFSSLPTLAVYADGRAFSQGPVDAIYPGPLLPNVQVRQLTPTGLARLLDAAVAAGLAGPDASYPPHGVADAPDTVFVVVKGGHATTISFGALGIGTGEGATPAEMTARQSAQAFLEKAGDLAALVGQGEVGPDMPFAAPAFQILAWPGNPSDGAEAGLARSPIAWPLATPLAAFGAPVGDGLPEGARCGVAKVSEPGGPQLASALASATTITGFSSADRVWTILPRPLLPDDPGCLNPAR